MTKYSNLPIVFALFWTVIVGIFDVVIGLNLYRAVRAQGFVTTTATVTHSEIATHSDSDGRTYGVDIRYDYRVQGQKYSGDNYRYMSGASSDSDWANDAVREYAVGAIVPVYYDENNPTESVLKPGVGAGDLFMLMFMTPFNLVMGGMWWYAGRLGWHRWNGTEPTSINAFRDRGTLRLRLPDAPPVMAGFVGLGLAAFFSVFVVAFSSGFHPSMTFVSIMWALVIASGIGSGLWFWRKQQEGAYDVLINDRTIDLPATQGRTERETVERRTITGVSVQKIPHEGKNGETFTYAVSLQRRGSEDAKVADWSDEYSANELAKWLTEQLRLPQHRS